VSAWTDVDERDDHYLGLAGQTSSRPSPCASISPFWKRRRSTSPLAPWA